MLLLVFAIVFVRAILCLHARVCVCIYICVCVCRSTVYFFWGGVVKFNFLVDAQLKVFLILDCIAQKVFEVHFKAILFDIELL